MRGVAGILAVLAFAGLAEAQESRWSYLPPDPEGADATAPFHRAEIETEDAIATLGYVPEGEVWRLFVLHRDWIPSRRRELVAVYGDDRREILRPEIAELAENAAGNTDLRLNLPESFLDHLKRARILQLTSPLGAIEIPLSGSSKAIDALLAAVETVPEAEAPAAEAGDCDSLAAWAGDANAVAAPVAWADLDAEAAMMACFTADASDPVSIRHRFQFGRALLKADLPGGLGFIQEAADAGYPAAAAYLEAGPEG